MRRYLYISMALLLFVPQFVLAESTRLPSNYVLNYELPSDRWKVSVDAPEFAIEAMVVDMVHDKKKKGEEVDRGKLRALSEKFIKVNNLFIYNPATEAYLMFSLSPQNRKGRPPTEEAIRNSVRWTVDTLDDHAEVEDLDFYETLVESVEIPGAEYATLISSNNPLFGASHNFLGIIGYAHPYWLFIFYNDKARDPKDLSEMKRIIESIELGSP